MEKWVRVFEVLVMMVPLICLFTGCVHGLKNNDERILYFADEAPLEGYEEKGPYPEEVRNWTDEEKSMQREAAKELLFDIYDAAARGDKEFRIPPGDYRFDLELGMGFMLFDISDITIDGSGANFWFTPQLGIAFDKCENVTLRGITIDYDPYPFMQARVKNVNYRNKYVDVEFDPDYPTPPEGDLLTGLDVRFFHSSGRWLHVMWDVVKACQPVGNNTYRIFFQIERLFNTSDYQEMLSPGDWLVIMRRTSNAMLFSGCNGITIEDITVYAAPNMVIQETTGKGGNVYRNIRVVRRPGTNRLLVSGRDVFHSYLMEKGPIVENNEFTYAGDDLIAVHGFFSVVLEQLSPTEIVLVTPFERDFKVGSTLRFYSYATTEPLGEAEVYELSHVHDVEMRNRAENLPQSVKNDGFYGMRPITSSRQILRVKLSQPVKLDELSVAECTELVGAGAIIRNNYLHDSQSRGIYVRSRDVVIENNTLERLTSSGIVLQADSYWLEGPFSSNISITGNTLVDIGWLSFNQHYFHECIGAIQIGNWFGKRLFSPMFHAYKQNHDIDISNNSIIRPASFAMLLVNVRDSQINDNTIQSPFSKRIGVSNLSLKKTLGEGPAIDSTLMKRAEEPYYGIFLMAAENVLLGENKVLDPPEDFQGIVGIGPWSENVTNEDE